MTKLVNGPARGGTLLVQANEAYARMLANDVRFRAVLRVRP